MPPQRTAPHGTTSRWRTGCREHGDGCLEAHNTETRDHKRRQREAVFTVAKQRKVLRRCRSGAAPKEAAEAVGITVQALRGFARSHPEFGEALREALMVGRRPDIPHGTPMGYRHYGCRCPECSEAHHPKA
jgi:hypothetical protein